MKMKSKYLYLSVCSILFLLHTISYVPAQQYGTLRLNVVDSDSGRILPCRLNLLNASEQAMRTPETPFWYDHFPVEGKTELKFPLGRYALELERGLEYKPLTGYFILQRFSKDERTEKLHRFTNLAQHGWWSGDLFLKRNMNDLELLMRADDVYHATPITGQTFSRIEYHRQLEKENARHTAADILSQRKNTIKRTQDIKDIKKEADDNRVVSFDSDRKYSRYNFLYQRPGCSVGILNLSHPLECTDFLDEEKSSPAAFLYSLRKKEPHAWYDLNDSLSWDLPLLVALGLVDSYQLLGARITRDGILHPDISWENIPVLKGKKTLNKSLKEKGMTREKLPYPCEFPFNPDVNPIRYTGSSGVQRWTEDVYYHLLNVGLRIPPSAGSGSGLGPNNVGANRVYIHVDNRADKENEDGNGSMSTDKKEDFKTQPSVKAYCDSGIPGGVSWDVWWEAFREGAVVVTNGPLMQPCVENTYPGHIFFAENESSLELEIGLTLSTRSNISYLEIILNGKVNQSIRFQDYAATGRLPKIKVNESGWFIIRAVSDTNKTFIAAQTAPFYIEFPQKPYISRTSAEFFLNWELERIKILEKKHSAGEDIGNIMKYHQLARAYWEKKVKQATAE